MDRAELADFLHTRRHALQPEDVGLPRGRRRRTPGLRREEVAELSSISTDYYSRLEQRRGPHPSKQILASISRGLHLSSDERDRLFRIAGYPAPQRTPDDDRVNRGMTRVFDLLEGTPALVMNRRGETLIQNRLAIALLGKQTGYIGMARSVAYRWFTDPGSRQLFPKADHLRHGRIITAQLRDAYTSERTDPRIAALVNTLLTASREFAAIWHEYPVTGPYCEQKRIEHPQVGTLELHGERMVDPGQSQTLVVFTAVPGGGNSERLGLLHDAGSLPFPVPGQSLPSRLVDE
jgi:transcriptional regulator with XRE-family HTH domain